MLRKHVKRVRQKCFVGLTKLRRIGRNVPMTTRKMLYSALILPHVDYCSVVWDQLTKDLERKVETIQNVGMRIILNAPRMATGTEMRQKLGWCTLAQRRKKNWPTNVSTMLALHTSITSSDTRQMLVASALEDRTVVNCT